MNQHHDNPPSNQLPSGVSETKLIDAVRSSGYPLQSLVAHELGSKFHVVEEWGYTDRAEKSHRALDIYAFRELQAEGGGLKPRLHLLVECKRSELPFVFFVPGVDRSPRDFPEILGCPGYHLRVGPNAHQDVSPGEFFCANELPFVSRGPTIATSFTRADRKGDGFELSGAVPFNKVVLPLASAMEQMQLVWHGASVSPMIVLAMCVIDAPMVVARGTPEDADLTAEPCVRVLHQEAMPKHNHWMWRHYTVDFVHRRYLGKYIDDHAIPFAEALAGRLIQYQARSPKGSLERSKESTWAQFMENPAQ